MDDGLKLIKKELNLAKKSKALVWIVVPILFFDFSLILWSMVPSEDFGYNVDFSFSILILVNVLVIFTAIR